MVDCPRRHAVNRPFPCGFGKEGKLEGSAMGEGDRLPCKISNSCSCAITMPDPMS